MLKTNKAYTLYTHPEGSYVVSLASSPNGQAVICGHLDGSVYRFTFPQEEGGAGLGSALLVQHSCVPYALGWGASIGAAGNDNRVSSFPPTLSFFLAGTGERNTQAAAVRPGGPGDKLGRRSGERPGAQSRGPRVACTPTLPAPLPLPAGGVLRRQRARGAVVRLQQRRGCARVHQLLLQPQRRHGRVWHVQPLLRLRAQHYAQQLGPGALSGRPALSASARSGGARPDRAWGLCVECTDPVCPCTSPCVLLPHTPQTSVKQVDNFYAVSSLSWKPDGSKLCVGGMTGAVDVYDACVRVSRGLAGCQRSAARGQAQSFLGLAERVALALVRRRERGG